MTSCLKDLGVHFGRFYVTPKLNAQMCIRVKKHLLCVFALEIQSKQSKIFKVWRLTNLVWVLYVLM